MLLAALPPHVHPEVLSPALALAALAGLVAPRLRVSAPAALLAVAAIALNVASSLQTLQSLRTIALMTAFVLTGLCCAGLSPRQRGRWSHLVFAAVALAGSALALHGLQQALFVFGRPEATLAPGGAIPEAIRARIASGRAVGTFGLPGVLGGFLAMSIPITAIWVLDRQRRAPVRVMAGILVAIQCAGLVATRSASALAALGVAGALVLWQRARAADGARRRTLAIRALGIASAGIAIAAVLLALRLSGPTAADEGSGPILLRALNWKVALEIFAGHPILGAGAGCYGIAFPALREWGMNESRFAHNSYLQVLAEGGLLLGVPILMAAACFARRLWRGAAADVETAGVETPSVETLLGSVACLAFMVHNLAVFTVFLPTTGMTFACIAGTRLPAAAEPRRAARRSSVRPVAGPGHSRGVRWAPVRPAAGVALALAAFAVVAGTADRARDASGALYVERNLEEALPLAQRASRLNPIDPEARTLESQIRLEIAAARRDPSGLPAAEELAQRAVDLDPRTPGRWRHLGRVRLARGDLTGAYLALARAAALYPIRIEYREERDMLRDRILRQAGPG